MTIRRHRRHFPFRLPSRFRGLRPRLVTAFVLVSLVSGAAAAAASYVVAREAVLRDAQDPLIDEVRDRLTELAPGIRYPPAQQDLDRLAGNFEDQQVLIVYEDLQSPEPGVAPRIPAALRERVRQDNAARWQRVEDGLGQPRFVFGMTLTTASGEPSGIELYLIQSLGEPAATIADLAYSAARTTAITLILAVVLALIAAQGVLRPVRDLRHAARRLAAGELDTRLRVRGSDELADLVLTFNNTAADLEYNVGELRRMEANARRFVADVSHELRTPLAAMTAVTDTLDEESANLDGDAATAARLVSLETRRLGQLVENLIEITRFDAGRAELRIDGEVELAAAVSATLASRGWTDQVETDLPPGVTAELDRRRLDVIVANLVGNALRHGAPPVRVAVRSDVDGDGARWVTVLVTDHGTGLSPEIGPHVFERFYKAEAARGRSEGSGLGLAIALENARLHAGTIEAANLPGGGAVFRVALPARRPGRSSAGPAPPARPKTPPESPSEQRHAAQGTR